MKCGFWITGKCAGAVRGERPIWSEKIRSAQACECEIYGGWRCAYDYAKAPLSHEDVTIDTRRLDDYELLSAEEILGGGAVFLIERNAIEENK